MGINYGFPYLGSKSRIAKDILEYLPEGNRLIDLFAGGGSISHCAALNFPKKWEKIIYNDIVSLNVTLFKEAIEGKFNYENSLPKWIDRKTFHENKNIDGYIRYIWSFSNNGKDYLFSKEIEEYKHAVFQAIIYRDYSLLDARGINVHYFDNIDDINERRLEWRKFAKENLKDSKHFMQMQCIESLQRLQKLQQLNNLNNIELLNISYENYEYKEGDIVYCDIPYQNTKCGCYSKFDHQKFYDWAAIRDYQIWFSSYENLGDDRFKCVWKKQKVVLNSAKGTLPTRMECLYTNK